MRRSVILALVILLISSLSYSQRRYGEGQYPPRYPTEGVPSSSFAFCRLQYRQVRSEMMGMGWVCLLYTSDAADE